MSRAKDIRRINQQIKHFNFDRELEEHLSRWIYECPPSEKPAVTDALVAIRSKRRKAREAAWAERQRKKTTQLSRLSVPSRRRRLQILRDSVRGWM